jgi:hypothetical protein
LQGWETPLRLVAAVHFCEIKPSRHKMVDTTRKYFPIVVSRVPKP